ncbi:MAG: hypothetical protein IH820_09330 [Bacteroidetes bacterium]|nr:hypothetical protein [Bacteroidota bacterium]
MPPGAQIADEEAAEREMPLDAEQAGKLIVGREQVVKRAVPREDQVELLAQR